MKNKGAIIGIVVLVVVFGALGAGYVMYIQPTFDQYKKDDRDRATLEETYKNLEKTFQGYKPELLLDAWKEKLGPWRSARNERATFFNFGDWFNHEKPTEEARARMLKFWYSEISNKMLQDFYADLYKKYQRYDTYPQDLRGMIGVAVEQDWQGRDVKETEITKNLDKFAFGLSTCRMLLKNNVPQVSMIKLWPTRIAEEYGQLFFMQTVGLQFSVNMKDFAAFMEDLRASDRYFSIDALQVTYPYIAYDTEPQLQISLLLSQANYRKGYVEKTDAESVPGTGPGGVSAKPNAVQMAPPVEPGPLGKAWKWFKYNVLVMQ